MSILQSLTYFGWKAVLVSAFLLFPLVLACWRMTEIPTTSSEAEVTASKASAVLPETSNETEDSDGVFSIQETSVEHVTLFGLTAWGPRWFLVHSNRVVGVIGIVAAVVLFSCVTIGVLVPTKASTQRVYSTDPSHVPNEGP